MLPTNWINCSNIFVSFWVLHECIYKIQIYRNEHIYIYIWNIVKRQKKKRGKIDQAMYVALMGANWCRIQMCCESHLFLCIPFDSYSHISYVLIPIQWFLAIIWIIFTCNRCMDRRRSRMTWVWSTDTRMIY